MRRMALVSVLLGGLLLPGQAHAFGLELGLTGGYWFAGTPQFGVGFGAGQALGRNVSINLRAGLIINTSFLGGQPQFGVPVDAVLRINVQRLYIEGLGGPTFLFGVSDFLRAHIAVGFGVLLRGFSFGVEAGWLQNGGILLARFGFHI